MSRIKSILSAVRVLAVCTALVSAAFAQTNPAFKTLAQFSGTNGANPVSQPIQLPNGDLLGVTLSSQIHKHSPSAIYEVTNKGLIQPIYHLASDGSQGAVIANGFSNNAMVQASDGNIYGVMNYATGDGYGLIYRFTFPSTFQVLHTFAPSATDCGMVFEAMVQALDGNLYGLCYEGGAYSAGGIFRVGLDGSYAFLYSLENNSAVGGSPEGGFTAHPNGLLYGTTTISSVNLPDEYGTLFQFDPVSQQVSLVSASDYSPGSQVFVGTDLALYLIEYVTSGALLVRYGTDGTGPQTVFNFAPTVEPSPWNTLSAVSSGVYVGGYNPYYQLDVNTQVLTKISIPAHSASVPPVGNLTETAGGMLVGVWPSTSQSPYFGELIEYSGGYPKPAPTILGFYPHSVQPGQTVTILGSFFVGTSTVAVGGNNVSYTVKASGAIQFVAPLGPQAGVISVTNGGGSVSSTQVLTVN